MADNVPEKTDENVSKTPTEGFITEGFIKTCRIADTGKVEIQVDPVPPYAFEYESDEKCCLLAIASPKNENQNDGSKKAKLFGNDCLFEWKCDNLKSEALSICVTLKTAHARCRFTLQEKCIMEVEIL